MNSPILAFDLGLTFLFVYTLVRLWSKASAIAALRFRASRCCLWFWSNLRKPLTAAEVYQSFDELGGPERRPGRRTVEMIQALHSGDFNVLRRRCTTIWSRRRNGCCRISPLCKKPCAAQELWDALWPAAALPCSVWRPMRRMPKPLRRPADNTRKIATPDGGFGAVWRWKCRWEANGDGAVSTIAGRIRNRCIKVFEKVKPKREGKRKRVPGDWW